MATDETAEEATVATQRAAQSLTIARAGVRTGEEFAELMSALMGDILEGDVHPTTAAAVVNAGRQLLRVVEMQHRYATPGEGGRTDPLRLVTGARGTEQKRGA